MKSLLRAIGKAQQVIRGIDQRFSCKNGSVNAISNELVEKESNWEDSGDSEEVIWLNARLQQRSNATKMGIHQNKERAKRAKGE